MKILLAVIFVGGGLFLVFTAALLTERYGGWRDQMVLANLVGALKSQEIKDKALAMADTYGGKTPKETLDLFVAAVEKKDYALASKYFVIPKQEQWRLGLQKIAEKNNVNSLLSDLHKMQMRSLLSETATMAAKDSRGIYSTFIEFTKYPNGIWKLENI